MTHESSSSIPMDPAATSAPSVAPSTDKPVGTIGVLTTEWGRSPRFWMCYAHLLARLPFVVQPIYKFSLNIAEARNEVVRAARDNGSEWVWFIDDDHQFPDSLLLELLARNVPIVQPLVLSRYSPFGPVAMGRATGDGKAHWKLALTPNMPQDGMKVEVVGAAGMLIRRAVWETRADPWFTYGEVQSDVTSEDMIFCRKARSNGFEVWVDLANRMSHLNIGEVWPMRQEDGTWYTRLIFGGQALDFETAQPKFKVDPDGKAYTIDGVEIANDYDTVRRVTAEPPPVE
jgi:glycosyltransferase involved in cell wall biosynthesis